MPKFDRGVMAGSLDYPQTPSEKTKELLYYLTDCGLYYCDFGYRVEREDNHNFLFLYILKGMLAVSSGGETYLAQAGQCVLLNCHEQHCYYATKHVTFLWAHFDGLNSEQMYRRFVEENGSILYEDVKGAKQICRNLTALVSSCQNSMKMREDEQSRLLYDSLLTLLYVKGHEKSGEGDERMEVAKEYIRDHLGEELTLASVASEAGFSVSHFSRLFKKETGVSPYEYIVLLRLNKAKFLLQTTDLQVKEIALEVGYQSESTFYDAFVERVGCPPGKYRRYQLS